MSTKISDLFSKLSTDAGLIGCGIIVILGILIFGCGGAIALTGFIFGWESAGGAIAIAMIALLILGIGLPFALLGALRAGIKHYLTWAEGQPPPPLDNQEEWKSPDGHVEPHNIVLPAKTNLVEVDIPILRTLLGPVKVHLITVPADKVAIRESAWLGADAMSGNLTGFGIDNKMHLPWWMKFWFPSEWLAIGKGMVHLPVIAPITHLVDISKPPKWDVPFDRSFRSPINDDGTPKLGDDGKPEMGENAKLHLQLGLEWDVDDMADRDALLRACIRMKYARNGPPYYNAAREADTAAAWISDNATAEECRDNAVHWEKLATRRDSEVPGGSPSTNPDGSPAIFGFDAAMRPLGFRGTLKILRVSEQASVDAEEARKRAYGETTGKTEAWGDLFERMFGKGGDPAAAAGGFAGRFWKGFAGGGGDTDASSGPSGSGASGGSTGSSGPSGSGSKPGGGPKPGAGGGSRGGSGKRRGKKNPGGGKP